MMRVGQRVFVRHNDDIGRIDEIGNTRLRRYLVYIYLLDRSFWMTEHAVADTKEFRLH